MQESGEVRKSITSIRNVDVRGGDGWSVLAYCLNGELCEPSRINRLYGLVVPCGSYKSENEAQSACDRIAAVSGMQCVVVCRERRPFPLKLVPNDESIVYHRNENDNVNEMQLSIERERSRREQVQMRAEEERKERNDPNTMSYLINSIYHLTSADEELKELEMQRLRLHEKKEKALKEVEANISLHPEHAKEWKTEALRRLQERGEMNVYHKMVSSWDSMGYIH